MQRKERKGKKASTKIVGPLIHSINPNRDVLFMRIRGGGGEMVFAVNFS